MFLSWWCPFSPFPALDSSHEGPNTRSVAYLENTVCSHLCVCVCVFWLRRSNWKTPKINSIWTYLPSATSCTAVRIFKWHFATMGRKWLRSRNAGSMLKHICNFNIIWHNNSLCIGSVFPKCNCYLPTADEVWMEACPGLALAGHCFLPLCSLKLHLM